jgi:predicted Zn-dependent protease
MTISLHDTDVKGPGFCSQCRDRLGAVGKAER